MKKFLNIDKLELSYKLSFECKSKLESINELSFSTFTLIRKNNNSNYRNNFEIILNDSGIFGNLYFGSYNVNRQMIYISVDNKILYSNELIFLLDIESNLNLELYTISKLDLALDYTYNFINRFYKLLKNEELEFIILNKKYSMNDKISTLLNVSTGTRMNIHLFKSFYINNKEKGLSLSAYNKLKEIQDNDNNKSYISDLINSDKIFRLEIRTNHTLLKDSLLKLGYTDSYLHDILINRINDELFELYNHLLYRLIRISYKNNTYSLLKFIDK